VDKINGIKTRKKKEARATRAGSARTVWVLRVRPVRILRKAIGRVMFRVSKARIRKETWKKKTTTRHIHRIQARTPVEATGIRDQDCLFIKKSFLFTEERFFCLRSEVLLLEQFVLRIQYLYLILFYLLYE
jgi:hypothetical protein